MQYYRNKRTIIYFIFGTTLCLNCKCLRCLNKFFIHILWNIFPDQIFKAVNVGRMAVPVRDEEGEYHYFGETYSFKIMDINLEDVK